MTDRHGCVLWLPLSSHATPASRPATPTAWSAADRPLSASADSAAMGAAAGAARSRRWRCAPPVTSGASELAQRSWLLSPAGAAAVLLLARLRPASAATADAVAARWRRQRRRGSWHSPSARPGLQPPQALALRRRAPGRHIFASTQERRKRGGFRVRVGWHTDGVHGGRKERVLAHPEAERSCESRDQPVTTTSLGAAPDWRGGSHTSLRTAAWGRWGVGGGSAAVRWSVWVCGGATASESAWDSCGGQIGCRRGLGLRRPKAALGCAGGGV